MAQAITTDQYVSLDAAETLSMFMVDGQPDPARFRDVIGGLLDRTADFRRTRVFGEMVALLWAEQKQVAAAQLEAFWNDLGRAHRFSLFCAYPMSGFHGEGQSNGFNDICCKHSSIIPTESYAQLSTMAERRRSVALLQQRAMSLELEVVERKRAEQEIRRLNDELNRKVDEYKEVMRELEHSRATLSDKLRDLEIFHDVAVNRELKMMALEKELDAIKGKCNA